MDTSKQIGAGLAALGVFALGAIGVLSIQTKECAQCTVDLAVAEEHARGEQARTDLLQAVADACQIALNGDDNDP